MDLVLRQGMHEDDNVEVNFFVQQTQTNLLFLHSYYSLYYKQQSIQLYNCLQVSKQNKILHDHDDTLTTDIKSNQQFVADNATSTDEVFSNINGHISK